MPARQAAGGAVSQRQRRRGHFHSSRQRNAAHHFRPPAVQAVRLRRHSALHDLSHSTSSTGDRSRTCSSSSRPARRPSRPLPESRRPAPAGRPYCERDLHGPTEPIVIDRRKRRTCSSRTAGADALHAGAAIRSTSSAGTAWSIRSPSTRDDFEPITGTIHQPPPVHQTFEAPGFVVCTFAPRMLDMHPEAIKIPYAHSNVQADEVLYYVRAASAAAAASRRRRSPCIRTASRTARIPAPSSPAGP